MHQARRSSLLLSELFGLGFFPLSAVTVSILSPALVRPGLQSGQNGRHHGPVCALEEDERPAADVKVINGLSK